MKKVLAFVIVMIGLFLTSCKKEEAKSVLELVSNETVTVSAKGGDCTIEVNSNSKLTATCTEDWVEATVVDDKTVVAKVAAYEGTEVRTATVTISNEGTAAPVKVRINQAAVVFDFTPADYEFEAAEGSHSFAYTAEAPLTAVVDKAVDWLKAEVTATELVLTVTANETLTSRAADVDWTIGAAKGTFTVSQKGAEATLEGTFDDINASVNGVDVVYSYTTNSELEANSEQDWIETYAENGELHIKVLANEGPAREGAVAWSVVGSETLKGTVAVSQKGAFLSVSLIPTVFSSDAASTLCNTVALSLHGTGVTAVKYSNVYTAADFAAVDVEKEKADVKAGTRSFNATWLGYVNGNGLNLTVKKDCTPSTEYYMVLWASNGDDEAYYVVNTSTMSENIFGDYDINTQFYTIQSKSQLYGRYYFLAKTTDDLTAEWGQREFMGMVMFSDGESSQDDYGTYDWVNVEGMWSTFFNSNYKLTKDISQFDLSNGFLISQEASDLGDLVKVADGSVAVPGFRAMVGFAGTSSIYTNLYGVLAGGIIDETGTIAFISTEDYADLDNPNAGKDEDELAKLGNYTNHFLFSPGNGWFGAMKDPMFVPDASYSPAKVAAASKTVDAIKREYRKMKPNYVEASDMRLERAFAKVLNDSKPAEAIAF
ncbi:MAG: BACON domain-containing protein [Candidatus Cryptobacteroides sp.]